MNTLLVWILVSYYPYGSLVLSYSPPLATKEDCMRIKDNTPKHLTKTCIQVRIPK